MTQSDVRRVSSLSEGGSYEEIGEFWDREDLGDHWSRTRAVDFDVELGTDRHYYAVEPALAAEIRERAHSRGISSEALVDQWLRAKLIEQ